MQHIMWIFRLALVIASGVLADGTTAAALTDIPVGGRALTIAARSVAQRTLAFRTSIDPAIAAPFPDPTAGATLVVHTSSASGQCHAEIALPAAFWAPRGGDAPTRGWQYRDASGSAQGVTTVRIVPRRSGGGRILVKAKGAGFPCGVEAPQTLPASVTLQLATTRYCAAFAGANVQTNVAGRLRATDAPPPAACPDSDVTLANLNILHGLFCPAATVNCRLADRIALLRQWIVARGCPDLVTLQEVADAVPNLVALLQDELLDACPAPYQLVFMETLGTDDEMILSRHPFLASELIDLYGPFRHMLRARIDHPIGAVDVYATHLASGSDGATSPCGAFGACPPECVAAAAATVRDCQAVQAALAIEATHAGDAPALFAGDLNAVPGSFVYNQFANRGWTDSHLSAGNPECVPATGVGCTSGRNDDDLSDLEAPALNQVVRIDFIFTVPPGPASLCAATLDSAADGDGDGTATRLFADEPNPFAPPCGPAPAAICWSSDHTGTQADLNCD